MKNYCIYTNKYFEEEEMNPEHIIPLSLGGSNHFCINVNAEINSKLGSEIDGKLTKDYLISCLRRRNDLRGHSKKEPITTLKKVLLKDSKRPVQMLFNSSGNHVYDLIDRRNLNSEETKGLEFQVTMGFDKHIRSLFIAKTILSAGYSIYGDKFIQFADHESLRAYMNFAFHRNKNLVKHLNLRFMDEFNELEDDASFRTRAYFELIFKELNCSAVMFTLCSEHFLASVAIAGKYLGTINFKADPKHFEYNKKLKGGHVIGIQNGIVNQSSFDHIENLIHEKYSRI